MAIPRVFVSSTYYDLKHIRASLEIFIESLGFEAILSEKGNIAYLPDGSLDESCYREAAASDIFVLLVGGRYGSAASGEPRFDHKALTQYDSITRREFEYAQDADVPTFILIESNVGAEYQTYMRNRENTEIKYAHVESVNVFRFIEFIYSRARNNPVYHFDRETQIEGWLRDQWAGLFRELLRSRSQQGQLLALTDQVGQLKSVNETLKTYLEAVLNRVQPDAAANIILNEEKRLQEERLNSALKNNPFIVYLTRRGMSEDAAIAAISLPASGEEVISLISEKLFPGEERSSNILSRSSAARRDLNAARALLGFADLEFPPLIIRARDRVSEDDVHTA